MRELHLYIADDGTEFEDEQECYAYETEQSAKKLKGKVALITGGDSGIGRAVAIAYAKEGAVVAISYLDEDQDAMETAQCIKSYGGECFLYKGDIRTEDYCKCLVAEVVKRFGRIDVLVNNAGVQFPQPSIEEITQKQSALN